MCIRTYFAGTNGIRLGWAIVYFIVGAALIIFSNRIGEAIDWIRIYWIKLSWVVGWSSVGIGVGLFNSRTKGARLIDDHTRNETRDREQIHYVLYFGFTLFVSSLAAYALGRIHGELDHALSALIGLTVGFASERLNDFTPIK